MREFTDYADFDQTWKQASREGPEFDIIMRRACQALEFELAGPSFEELADLYNVQVMPMDMGAYWSGGEAS